MKKGAAKHYKALPIHIACVTGNKGALKSIISTLPKRALEIKDYLGSTPLILTVSKNHIDCCAILLKAGVTVDNTDNAGQTALHIAASKGLHHFVKLLLQYKASWIQRDYSGATALHMAAVHPNVKGLLSVVKHVRPAEIDVQDSTSKTALHWSAAYACNDNIKVLLSQGANPCIPDEGGKTPLHWAAANSNPEALDCVKTLLKNKPSLINWQDYDGRSPLHIAVTSGSEEIVYYLASVEHSTTDIIDNSFLTPLHYAAKQGLSEKADILLKKRASHLSVDDNGAKPLHYAVYNNHAETVKVFTNKSYICDEPDNFGRTALIWAAIRNSVDALIILASAYEATHFRDKNGYTGFLHPYVTIWPPAGKFSKAKYKQELVGTWRDFCTVWTRMMINFTNSRDIVTSDAMQALHAAAIYGNVASIKGLVNAGLHVDSKDKNGMTPFLKSCEFGRTKAAQSLLNLGANMDEKDVNSSSALHWCARGGHAYLTDILIKRGADYNIKDDFRMTPLHYVSLAGDYVNCTCVLVESGASLNETDIDGKTPLHSAVLNERHGIVKYLCEHETDINAMFLMKNDWVTPYDCAMYRCNVKIAIMLEKCAGVQAENIKEYAVRLIQSWYKRKKRLTSKVFSYPSAKEKSSNVLSSRHVKQNFVPLLKCQICSPTDKNLFYICNECFHKSTLHRINKVHLNINKESVDCCSFSNISLSGSVPGYKLLAFCKNPCRCNDLIQLDSVVYNKSFFHVILGEKTTDIDFCNMDRAVRIIQKAWKRYNLKKKFSKVRNEVRLSYINHGERSTAEEIWQLSLQTFSKKVFE